MSTFPGVPGVPSCSRIKFFSYKLVTEDRKTDFDLKTFLQWILRVKRRNMSDVKCQQNLFLNFLWWNMMEHVDVIMNFRAK